jgi:hypothetical protein
MLMTRFSVLLGALACSLVLPLRAGDLTDGTVVRIASNIQYGEIVFIKTDKSKSSVPGCHTNLSWDFVMPLTSEHDKKLYAMLLAARASGTPVGLSGAGHCNHFGSIESLSGITW